MCKRFNATDSHSLLRRIGARAARRCSGTLLVFIDDRHPAVEQHQQIVDGCQAGHGRRCGR